MAAVVLEPQCFSMSAEQLSSPSGPIADVLSNNSTAESQVVDRDERSVQIVKVMFEKHFKNNPIDHVGTGTIF